MEEIFSNSDNDLLVISSSAVCSTNFIKVLLIFITYVFLNTDIYIDKVMSKSMRNVGTTHNNNGVLMSALIISLLVVFLFVM